MHNIHMAEFTEEFSHCWNAAGSHIQRMAGGDLMSWLKATLAPPFLEHLSFRLGNQLFFIQLEDEDGMSRLWPFGVVVLLGLTWCASRKPTSLRSARNRR